MHKCANVVLLSGGIDSALCALMAEKEKEGFTALTVMYGQNPLERDAARDLALYYKWRQVEVEVTPFPRSLDPAGANVIPGRNALFLSLAYAMIGVDYGTIWIGSNADDQENYPDCRGEFFEAFEAVTHAQKHPVWVKRPLIQMTKQQIVVEAKRRKLPIEKTVSCYQGWHCGVCDACKKRDAAL